MSTHFMCAVVSTSTTRGKVRFGGSLKPPLRGYTVLAAHLSTRFCFCVVGEGQAREQGAEAERSRAERRSESVPKELREAVLKERQERRIDDKD